MFYVYVLKVKGIKGKGYYIGYTSDLRRRLTEHQKGQVKTTKNKKPELVYYEAYTDKYMALRREKGIKNSGSVKMALYKRLQIV